MSPNALDLKNLKIFSELQDVPMRQLVRTVHSLGLSSDPSHLLCILNRKQVLHTPYAGQNFFFDVKASFPIFFRRKQKKEEKRNK